MAVELGEGAAMGDPGALVVVGTPIGNLADLSPRAAGCLREADLVACEDTRRTAVLLRHAGSSAPMVPVHRHNEAARTADLLGRIRGGARVALVSDAGMPLVSDPGARLVRAVAEAGLPVRVVPGPSAVTAALAASGLAGEAGFAFAGFPPRRGAARAGALRAIADSPVPVVVFESPRRLPALLADLAALAPDRALAVCREMTKVHEEVARGPAADLASRLSEPPRGEIAVVVGAAPGGAPRVAGGGADEQALRDALGLMLDAGMGARGAAEAAALLGAARNRAYALALETAEERRRRR